MALLEWWKSLTPFLCVLCVFVVKKNQQPLAILGNVGNVSR
ncbi:hypothetical protein MICAK_1330003 [Microcystis aeruginosa PCC 9701]|uniref:Uncharacterized protein n=1 Tax=Microcystis aeruginosa PCC 9701 TaxID=721123 RepID=I4ILD4_MICAE|nr:hypothetical protein MICAK_1330003 [Microcystis aeruginosa PCC 9701]